ncbi:hypothetical protein AGMMS50268_26520 [Spirochaetia bacterium]|nr:hypothetical protein AGMMS50268_26520 [Spirochaetia bacterium]
MRHVFAVLILLSLFACKKEENKLSVDETYSPYQDLVLTTTDDGLLSRQSIEKIMEILQNEDIPFEERAEIIKEHDPREKLYDVRISSAIIEKAYHILFDSSMSMEDRLNIIFHDEELAEYVRVNYEGIIKEAKLQQSREERLSRPDNDVGVPLELAGFTQDDKYKYLCSKWEHIYPLPNTAPHWAYMFYEDGDFTYLEWTNENKKKGYVTSSGQWRLNGNNIEICITGYEKTNKEAIFENGELSFPGDIERVFHEVTDTDWETIGSLESVRTGLIKSGRDIVDRIELQQLFFDRKSDKRHYFFRVYGDINLPFWPY